MTTTEDYAAYAAKRAAMAKLETETLPQNKAALFDALAAAGISRVVVCFDGSGDAGQIESVTACAADDAEVALPGTAIAMREVIFDGPAVVTEQRSVGEAIEIMAYAFLEETHAGWENDDGAFGAFIFSVAERAITLDYNERYTATNVSAHEF
jgi:tRNA(Arg) A34 adenosine deaminase TadA